MHQNSHAKDEKTEDDVCKDGEIYMHSFSSSLIEIEWGALERRIYWNHQVQEKVEKREKTWNF